MSSDLATFLGSTAIFNELLPEQLERLATLVRQERRPAGSLMLRQGAKSDAVYFVRTGQLAVRIQRGGWRETVAYLQPPDIFGELSFVTGKACVADVEVLVDADIVLLPREAVPQIPGERETLLRSLTRVIATRLQDTVTRGAKLREAPVVLLHNHDEWEAPVSFGWELGRSLARQTSRRTLLVQIGATDGAATSDIHAIDEQFSVCSRPAARDAETQRSEVARELTGWKNHFEDLILNPVGPRAGEIARSVQEFANWRGHMLGPQNEVPADAGDNHFVVQSMGQSAVPPRLPFLSGSRQVIHDAAQSEKDHLAGRSVSPKFQRIVDSMARCVAEIQVGLALGGGAAWGWAHIGVLGVLEQAGIPVDMVSGCSMGSVIGGLYCSGKSVAELEQLAEEYSAKTGAFTRGAIWGRLKEKSLINQKRVRKTLLEILGNRNVESMTIPYWANAVDIITGREFTIKDGPLVDCILSSIALPGLLPSVQRGGRLLIDAGMMDPVPVGLVKEMGRGFAISVNAMAKPTKESVDPSKMKFYEVIMRSMFLMGHEIGEARAEKTANVHFTPDLEGITMLQFARSKEIIERGRRAAEVQLATILDRYARLKEEMAGSPFQQQPDVAAQ